MISKTSEKWRLPQWIKIFEGETCIYTIIRISLKVRKITHLSSLIFRLHQIYVHFTQVKLRTRPPTPPVRWPLFALCCIIRLSQHFLGSRWFVVWRCSWVSWFHELHQDHGHVVATLPSSSRRRKASVEYFFTDCRKLSLLQEQLVRNHPKRTSRG